MIGYDVSTKGIARVLFEGEVGEQVHIEDGGVIAYVDIDLPGNEYSESNAKVGFRLVSELPPGTSPGKAVVRERLMSFHPAVAGLAGRTVRITVEVLS